MRISDWSSDVCSSDLNGKIPKDREPASLTLAECEQLLAETGKPVRGRFGKGTKKTASKTAEKPATAKVAKKVAKKATKKTTKKIGSTSWRERGCQDV